MEIKELTESEIKLVHNTMQRTWDYIGSDMLEVNDGKAMPKSHVIEVVLDANYMETSNNLKPEEKDIIKKFRQLSYKDQIKVAKQTFTFARYGY